MGRVETDGFHDLVVSKLKFTVSESDVCRHCTFSRDDLTQVKLLDASYFVHVFSKVGTPVIRWYD